MQENIDIGGSTWLLGSSSSNVIGPLELQMQASNLNLTNKSGTSTVPIPSVAIVKL